MRIGSLILFDDINEISKKMGMLKQLKLNCCQLCCWEPTLLTNENAAQILKISKENGVEITALWAGWTGPQEWNFYAGPETLGLVPEAYRSQRLAELKCASDFAELIQVTDVITHLGFIPENPNDREYTHLIPALRNLALYMKRKNQYFLFETGQETPVTMLRTIENVGTGNLGINFDTANPILYGKANPVDALRVFGKYVRNTHFKDGFYPTNGMELGKEVSPGEGLANFPEIIRQLHACNYTGPYTIEREIDGKAKIGEIEKARDIILNILRELGIE